MISKQTLRRIRLVSIGLINSVVFKLFKSNNYKTKDAIIICGAMRSGSTWLAELLSAMDGHIQVFEPLHPQYVKRVNKVGLGLNRYFVLDENTDNSQVKDLFNDILSGKYLNHWMLSQASIFDVFKAQTLVIKFVRANLLVDWMTRELNIRKPVVIIRHPCGTIASTMKKDWVKNKQQILQHPYLLKFPEILAKCKNLESQEELSAILWCIQYHPLLKPNKGNYILVSYESLVRDGENTLMNIYSQWNETPPPQALQQLQMASDTSTQDSMIKKGKDPLKSWLSYFTSEQTDKILKVLEHFDIQVYSSQLEPDYELLEKYNQ